MDEQDSAPAQPEQWAVDVEEKVNRGLRIAKILGKKLARKIEETVPATKGTDWKKVAKWGAVTAAAVVVGGELLGDGAGEVAQGAAGGESLHSGYGTTGTAVMPTGILNADGASSNFG